MISIRWKCDLCGQTDDQIIDVGSVVSPPRGWSVAKDVPMWLDRDSNPRFESGVMTHAFCSEAHLRKWRRVALGEARKEAATVFEQVMRRLQSKHQSAVDSLASITET